MMQQPLGSRGSRTGTPNPTSALSLAMDGCEMKCPSALSLQPLGHHLWQAGDSQRPPDWTDRVSLDAARQQFTMGCPSLQGGIYISTVGQRGGGCVSKMLLLITASLSQCVTVRVLHATRHF